jgi:hypothetical protein
MVVVLLQSTPPGAHLNSKMSVKLEALKRRKRKSFCKRFA